jgi:hypothetical protein
MSSRGPLASSRSRLSWQTGSGLQGKKDLAV